MTTPPPHLEIEIACLRFLWWLARIQIFLPVCVGSITTWTVVLSLPCAFIIRGIFHILIIWTKHWFDMYNLEKLYHGKWRVLSGWKDDTVKDQLLPFSEFLASQGEFHWPTVYSLEENNLPFCRTNGILWLLAIDPLMDHATVEGMVKSFSNGF